MRTKYLILLAFFLNACVSYDDFDTSTAEGAFGLAQALEGDDRFEEALMQYRDLKNRFPYSRYAVAAELQLAEVQFKKEAYIEAQGAYQIFKELHPKHSKIDYVTYQIGESIYQQLPSTIDRDLSLAPLAIKEFDVLIRDFPNSPHTAKARTRRSDAVKKLAEKELYIADFYYRTDEWQHALVRYEKYLRDYPSHDRRPHAFLRAGLAAQNFGNESKRKSLLRQLIEKYPQSKEAQQAKDVF